MKLGVFKSRRAVVGAILILTVCLNSYPFWAGELYGRPISVVDIRLRTYSTPREYLELEEWLRSHCTGDSKVLWLPAGGSLIFENLTEFYRPYGEARDVWGGFSIPPGTFTISYESSTGFGRMLMAAVESDRTEHLGDILALAGVKYVILRLGTYFLFFSQATPADKVLVELRQQRDLVETLRNGSVLVFRNDAWKPLLRAASFPALATGDRGLFYTLPYTPFWSNFQPLFFAGQLTADDMKRVGHVFRSIIIQENSWEDLVSSMLPESLIFPGRFAKEYDLSEWSNLLRWHWNRRFEYSLPLDECAITTGSSKLEIPFAAADGIHEVWVKTFVSRDGGLLSVFVDGALIGETSTFNPWDRGFIWRRIGRISLQNGRHKLTLQGRGENVVARVFVATGEGIDRAQQESFKFIRNTDPILVFEAESYFAGATGTRPTWVGKAASMGQVLEILFPTAIERTVFVPKEEDYNVFLRVRLARDVGQGKQESITINGLTHIVNSTMFKWLTFGSLRLLGGENKFAIRSEGQVEIDQVLLIPTGAFRSFAKPSFEYGRETNPTEYTVFVNSTEPCFLVFAENYDRLWKATVGNTDLDQFLVNSFANAYYVEATGNLSITLKYLPQAAYSFGTILITITLIAFGLVFGCLGWCTYIRPFLRRILIRRRGSRSAKSIAYQATTPRHGKNNQ